MGWDDKHQLKYTELGKPQNKRYKDEPLVEIPKSVHDPISQNWWLILIGQLGLKSKDIKEV